MNHKKSRQFNWKRLLLILLALVVCASIAVLVVRARQNKNSPPPTSGNSEVKLAPATPEEKTEADQKKDAIVDAQKDQTSTQPPQQGTKKAVSVVVTNASTGSINAYVTGVFEDGGTCTATFTQGTKTVTRTSNGFGNVSYTQCAPITPNLPNNNGWSVVVSYSSTKAEGKSQPQSL